MTMYRGKKVVEALQEALERENDPDRPRTDEKTIQALKAELAVVYSELARAENKIEEMKLYIRDLEDTSVLRGASSNTSRLRRVQGREVLTIKEVQRVTDYSYMQIYRAVTSGRWGGVKDGNGDWLIFRDQPLRLSVRKYARR